MDVDRISPYDIRLIRRRNCGDEEASDQFPHGREMLWDVEEIWDIWKTRSEAVAEAQSAYDCFRKRERCVGDYTGRSNHIDSGRRMVVVDWMIQVHYAARVCSDSLYLGVAIMDEFMSMLRPRKTYILLYGAASLLLASKYHDGRHAIKLATLTDYCEGNFTCEDMKRAESFVWQTLRGEFSFPTCHTFLECLLALDPNEEFYRYHHEICMCALDRALLSSKCLAVPPSKVAATALMLANHQWVFEGMQFWPDNLRRFARYSVWDMYTCAGWILEDLPAKLKRISNNQVVWVQKLRGMKAKYRDKGYPLLILPYVSPNNTKTLAPLYPEKSKKKDCLRHCPWHVNLKKPCPVHPFSWNGGSAEGVMCMDGLGSGSDTSSRYHDEFTGPTIKEERKKLVRSIGKLSAAVNKTRRLR